MKSVARLLVILFFLFLAAIGLFAACNTQAGPAIATPTAHGPLRSA